MRGRLTSTDGILLLTVVIWSLNITVTRYILTHGFLPLSYAALRYGGAIVIFVVITLVLERSLRIEGRRHWLEVGAAAFALLVNQICFVYALKLTTATTVALILGTMPVFAGLFASAIGLERLTGRSWLAAAVSFAGVGLVALGSGGALSSDLLGDVLAVCVAASWSAYSVAVAPLMRTYSPYRISAVALTAMWIPLVLIASPQIADQDVHLGALVWSGFFFAIVGPLVLTNVLWFTAVHRVGPSHATLFANLQPFIAALFAVVLLSESLSALELLGGAAIAVGILLAPRPRTVAVSSE